MCFSVSVPLYDQLSREEIKNEITHHMRLSKDLYFMNHKYTVAEGASLVPRMIEGQRAYKDEYCLKRRSPHGSSSLDINVENTPLERKSNGKMK